MTDKWINLDSTDQLEDLNAQSFQKPVLIFKHSTRCSISAVSWSRFNSAFQKAFESADNFYYVDVIRNRNVSDLLAEKYQIRHESPQILLISEGVCINNASHFNISFSQVEELVKQK